MVEEMANVQKLARQALKTFRQIGSTPSKQNMDKLNTLLSSITAEDLNLSDPIKDRRRSLPGAPPVSHIDILECQYFSMGIFIVSKGETLPLHDHTGMYGLCKILYGTIQVKMYDKYNSKDDENQSETLNEKGLKKCYFNSDSTYNSSSEACLVTPTCGNYHSIKAIGRSAAFLDILAPPYASEKYSRGPDCFYYKECKLQRIQDQSNVRYLVQIQCPSDFFCDIKPYTGPRINLEERPQSCDED